MEKFKSSFNSINAVLFSTFLAAGALSVAAVLSDYSGVVDLSIQANGIRLILDGSNRSTLKGK
jgi:hypothetical protein